MLLQTWAQHQQSRSWKGFSERDVQRNRPVAGKQLPAAGILSRRYVELESQSPPGTLQQTFRFFSNVQLSKEMSGSAHWRTIQTTSCHQTPVQSKFCLSIKTSSFLSSKSTGQYCLVEELVSFCKNLYQLFLSNLQGWNWRLRQWLTNHPSSLGRKTSEYSSESPTFPTPQNCRTPGRGCTKWTKRKLRKR